MTGRIHLRPAREDELPGLLEQGRREYAEDLVQNGGLSSDAAVRKAEQDMERLFPGGAPQRDHFFYVLETESGELAGRLWWAIEERDSRRVGFLYDVHLDSRFRGRGLGREAMALLEDDVRAQGLDRIQLNVFGGNERARLFYRSLGYTEQAVHMRKRLGPS